jgi:hypothetical protein
VGRPPGSTPPRFCLQTPALPKRRGPNLYTYQIPEATLRYWKGRARAIPVDPQKENVIGDLLIEYLEANLRALKAQAEVFTDKTWLTEQGASEAAILHGVMTDKAVRLIEAFSAHDSDTAPTD